MSDIQAEAINQKDLLKITVLFSFNAGLFS